MEERDENTAELGVVEPIVPGTAQVPPNNDDALMVPEPVKSRLALVPTTMAALVFVALVRPEKGILEAVIEFVQVGDAPEPPETR